MYPPPGVLRPEERLQQHYQQDYQLRELDIQGRDLDYQRGLQGKSGTSDGSNYLFLLAYLVMECDALQC